MMEDLLATDYSKKLLAMKVQGGKDMAEKEICTMIKLVKFFEVNQAKN